MNICYYGNQLGFVSGSHRYALGLAKRFTAQGHQVMVVTKGRASKTWENEGVRYQAVSLESRETFASYYVEFPLRSLLHFARHRDFDIIHSMASYHVFAILARMVGAVSRTPIVYGVVSPGSRALSMMAFAKLICASRNIQAQFGEKGVFIPHFIELDSFNTAERYNFGQDDHFTVGSMGSPALRRGFEHLIRAMPLVLEQHPDTRFVLAIEHPQIKYRPKLQARLRALKELIQDYGVSDSVTLVGRVDVPRFLNSLDVFVYAVQTTKGMIDIPPTILECLAGGCALVSSPKGGIPEAVRSYENGILVDEGDYDNPEAYARKVVELIENRDLVSTISLNARRSAQAYDVNEIAPRVMRVYEEVLSCQA